MRPDTQKRAGCCMWKGLGGLTITTAVTLAVVCLGLVGCGKPEKPSSGIPSTGAKPPTESPELPQQPAKTPEEHAGLSEAEQTRAKKLYTQHCQACHGEKGDSEGVVARYLFPKPRDFRAGAFRLVSTTNGVPTIADLELVLSRGMPGSAMPPWPGLSEADRKLLAKQVMEFRRQGIREREMASAKEVGEEVDEDELKELIGHLTTPGPAIEVPKLSESTAEAIARGKQLYLTVGCAGCHGKEGKGDGTEKMINVEGLPNLPRDLTKGIFKGNPDPASVYQRTQAGMPGSAMPAIKKLNHEQISDLVHFVLSLSDEATRAATVLNREQIVARSVQQVPDSPSDASWNDITPIKLRLTPLRWRDKRVAAVEVRAVHDGSKIALQLSWDDAVQNGRAVRVDEFSDAIAAQFSPSLDPPFMGMGAKDAPVNTWYWKADHPGSGQTVAGIETAFPNMIVGYYPFEKSGASKGYTKGGSVAQQDSVFVAGWSARNPVSNPQAKSSIENVNASGAGTLSEGAHVRSRVAGRAVWKSGKWQVVMSRSLDATDERDVVFKPGESVSVAFAIWEGSAKDRDGQKQVSIWQKLTLEK